MSLKLKLMHRVHKVTYPEDHYGKVKCIFSCSFLSQMYHDKTFRWLYPSQDRILAALGNRIRGGPLQESMVEDKSAYVGYLCLGLEREQD